MQVNAIAPFRLIQSFLPSMMATGHGRIVNISSILGLVGIARMTDYCASKYAIYGLNEALRRELKAAGHRDIRTLIVLPFHTGTTLFGNRMKWQHRWLLDTLSPSYVARRIVEGVEAGQEELILPYSMYAFYLLNALPAWINDALQFALDAGDGISDMDDSQAADV